MKRPTRGLIAVAALLLGAQAVGEPTAARIVTWQPHAGAAHNFEHGYRRHLEWHRQQHDPWSWYGWSILTGERSGWFVDGTFFHEASDFDRPIAPAADRADNEANVEPHARLHSVVAYEMLPALSREATPALLASPFLSFFHIEIRPGRNTEFETAAAGVLRNTDTPRIVFRPISGSMTYLLVLGAEHQSKLTDHAGLLSDLLRALAPRGNASAIVTNVHNEAARFRSDLSYMSE